MIELTREQLSCRYRGPNENFVPVPESGGDLETDCPHQYVEVV